MEQVRPTRVRLRVETPSDISIVRQEVRDRVLDSGASGYEAHGSIATGGHVESRQVGKDFAEHLLRRSFVFARRMGQTIVLGGDCCITLLKISNGSATLGIDAPVDLPIFRGEVHPEVGLTAQSALRATSPPDETFSHSSVSVEELLEEVGRLDPSDLRKFVSGVLKLRASKVAPLTSARESDLLLRINEGLPEGLSGRLEELAVKRDAEVLTDDEYGELLRLSDEAEQREAERLKILEELAALRHLSLPVLMRGMGLTVPVHG